ncbi:HpcH/HpaI aldolase family protein [Dactylosporangium sp. CS-033363]|uniref:HpcH/HpaI aldolase family protein n=1 Tax=Dactylosporangium sp. CS-033363 TaxID=3239935 RepID=UPI003D8ED2CB
MLRTNRMRELLAENRPLLGGHAFIPDATYVEFLGLAGFDWVFIDAEHGGVSVTKCYELVRAADAVGMASFVRLPSRDVEQFSAYMDTGVHALKVPHLRSVQDALDLRDALRFPPHGTRGISGMTRANNYGLGAPSKEYLLDRQQTIVISAMIEDAGTVEQLPQIIETGAIEIYSIGRSDLSASLGHTGEPEHPAVAEVYERAVATLRAAGQIFTATCTTAEAAQKAFAAGARLVSIQTPRVIGQFLKDFTAACKA